MDERVWGLAILASRDMDPVLGGSRAHNDGHMDMSSDQSMTSRIADEKTHKTGATQANTMQSCTENKVWDA